MQIASLPPVSRQVSARDIVMGAAASRDWQPQHHDHDHALAMNLPGIIMNTPTQTGWFHAYAMRWAGAGAEIRRWSLRMKRPVAPGMTIELTGDIVSREADEGGGRLVRLDLRMEEGGSVCSLMSLLLWTPEQP